MMSSHMYNTGIGHIGDLWQISVAAFPFLLLVHAARAQFSRVGGVSPSPQFPALRRGLHPDPVGLAGCKAPEAVDPS